FKKFLTINILIFYYCSTLFSQNLIQDNNFENFDENTITANVEIPIDSIVKVSPEDVLYEKIAIDTIDSKDKFIKIILFDDHTWNYLDLHKPQISEDILTYYWDSEKIHSYKELDIKTLPDEIPIALIDSLSGFCSPFVAKVSSPYCFRGKREHNGVDLKVQIGDTIRAAFDGKVRIAKASRYTGGYGNLVVIRHTNGLETYYGHLSKIIVEEDEYVKAGEVIGLGGSSGRSTGSHLHFETRYCGQSFDPQRIIDFETGSLKSFSIVLKKHYFSIYSNHKQTDEQSLAASQRIVHTIRSGDTLSGLASKYGTTIDKICKLNNISKSTTLRIGNKLIVR
ncbi:peptidoglycan DD-metalloendopeptidase family protein, partial [Bacteroidales bacterium OttesenSCG-928-K03]|nr:peptidoglycan DD-metalloendopeptidase family protein [Bacteroidales bacterium OttesenSCG-928-K03]